MLRMRKMMLRLKADREAALFCEMLMVSCQQENFRH